MVAVDSSSAVASVRKASSDVGLEIAWSDVHAADLRSALPWRTFRWRDGQKHYSGTYWSSTTAGHVIYESRLELSRLMLADFDLAVEWIVPQPFLISAVADCKVRRHIPDFLLFTTTGPVVVDVKPLERLSRPKVQFTFDWTRKLVEERGWRYQVEHEPDPVVLENVRFLAGFRRHWLFPPDLVEALRSGVVDGEQFSRACESVPGWPAAVVRSSLLHLMWKRHFDVELTEPLSSSLVLVRKDAA